MNIGRIEVPCVQARLAHDVRAGRGCGAAGAGGSEERPREDGTPPVPAPRRIRAVRRGFAAIAAKSRTAERQALRCEKCPGAHRMSRTRCSQLLGREFSVVQHPFPARLRRAAAARPDGARRPLRDPRRDGGGGASPPRPRADLTAVGPVNPATGFPDWYQDGTGPQAPALPRRPAVSASAPPASSRRPTARRSGGNAAADLRSARPHRASSSSPRRPRSPTAAGSRSPASRVRSPAASRNTTYTIQHPYGTLTVTTDANGDGRSADPDIGCAAAPCDFAAALGGQVGPFLRWDPTVAARLRRRATSATRRRRIASTGSPTGFNAFALSGGGLNLHDGPVRRSRASSPARPCPVADAAAPVDFGTTAAGAPPVQRTVTITSFGVPDAGGRSNLVVGAVAVAGSAGRGIHASSATLAAPRRCRPERPARSCVQLTPGAPGRYGATLSVATNAAGGQTAVALTGAATRGRRAAAGARGRLTVRRLRTTHRLTRARVLRRGLRLTMRLPQGTEIVKVAIRRVRHGRALRRPVWLGYRVVRSTRGLYRLRLDSRALRRRLNAGPLPGQRHARGEQAPARARRRPRASGSRGARAPRSGSAGARSARLHRPPVLGGQRVDVVVLPHAVDLEVAQRAALVAEADLLRPAPEAVLRGMIAGCTRCRPTWSKA